MLVYLDTCAIQRPLDDRNQLKIRVEGDIILAFVDTVEAGIHEIVTSAVLRYEVENNPINTRKDFCRSILALAKTNIDISRFVTENAELYVQSGIKPLDAVHLSSAIAAHADYLCSVDKSFLRKAQSANTMTTRVVSPEELMNVLAL